MLHNICEGTILCLRISPNALPPAQRTLNGDQLLARLSISFFTHLVTLLALESYKLIQNTV